METKIIKTGRRRRWLLVLIPAMLALAFAFKGCSTPIPRRNPVGEAFPSVQGELLTGEKALLPDIYKGHPVLLLVGFKQNSQFDIDRWLIGITMAKLNVKFAEVPTIPGMVPSLFSGMIDNGMRRGIPSGDWAGVLTTYGSEAEKIAQLTGNENPLPARVLLLDSKGEVVWFHDEGFSPRFLTELKSRLQTLRTSKETYGTRGHRESN